MGKVYGSLSYKTPELQFQSIIIDHAQVVKSVFFYIWSSKEAQTVFIVTVISLLEKLSPVQVKVHILKLQVFIIIS